VLLALPTVASAQQREITGTVTDRDERRPIQDATISISGTLLTARTNDRGIYRINAPTGQITIVVRHIGHKRTSVVVPAGQSTVDVAIEKDVAKIEGVVITGQATSVDRRNAPTAVSQVNAEELTSAPSTSLENALQGKVAGASINMNNGAPGGGGQIQIRGISSLQGNFQPLIVVDGVIVSNGNRSSNVSVASGSLNSGEENTLNRLSDFNPNDIESVEVLKSAAASAIYGSQATNGVILITTKRGKQGSPRFSLTQRIGVNELQRSLGSRKYTDIATLTDLAANVQGCADCTAWLQSQAWYTGNNAAAIPYIDQVGQFFNRKDPSSETVLSVSGGGDRTRYYFSANDKQDVGIAPNTGARKQSVLLNLDQDFGGGWIVNIGAQYIRNFAQRGISNNDNSNSSPLYVLGCTPSVIDLSALSTKNPWCGGYGVSSNPYNTFDKIQNNEDVNRTIVNAKVQWNAFSNAMNNVRFEARTGLDYFTSQNYVFFPPTLQYLWQGTNKPGLASQGNGDSHLMNQSVGGVWAFTPKGALVTFTTSAGIQIEQRVYNDYSLYSTGLPPVLSNANAGSTTVTSQGRSTIRNEAYYAQEQLQGFNDRLTVYASVRAEKSSVNGDRNKTYYWPRAAGSFRFDGWVPSMISTLKVRGGFGITGNQPGFGARDLVLGNYGLIGGNAGLGVPGTLGNVAIKPEKQQEGEIGLDFGLFKDRVLFEATYFDRTIRDLYLTAALPNSSGIGALNINGGKLHTRGREYTLTLLPVSTRDFTWTSRMTYSSNNAQLDSLAAGVAPFANGGAQRGFGTAYGRLYYTPGYNLTSIWGNRTANADGTGAITRTVVVGDANPQFLMSFPNDLRYKRWTAGFLVDWRKGGDISNMTLNQFDSYGVTWDYDTPSGNTTYPKSGDYRLNSWNGGANTVAYIQKGTYLKLREVRLSYDMPSSWFGGISQGKVSSLRVTAAGRNLWIKTKYNGYDPEVNNGGNFPVRFVDLAPWPPVKSFFLTFDVGF
jgi:TonB-linked SusC/RagA family outer membrane protein